MNFQTLSEQKRIFLWCLLSSILLLTLPLASAVGDVAYIMKNSRVVDQNIIRAFQEMNASVDLINDANVRTTDLTKYKLVFIGPERLRNTARYVDVSKYPTMIMNSFYGDDFGLVDDDGISSLASNSLLEVNYNNQVFPVYTMAKVGSSYLDYNYLSTENKAADLMAAATPYLGQGSNETLGDVVSYGARGDRLTNGKVLQNELCFFGIDQTTYWTSQAKNLFKDCAGFAFDYICSTNVDCNDNNNHTQDICLNPATTLSQCIHNPIICLNDNECGIDGLVGEPFCTLNNVSQSFVNFTCNNAGLTTSFCSNVTTTQVTEQCGLDLCVDGSCLEIECDEDLDCNDTNSTTIDTCLNPGTLNSTCINTPVTCFNAVECGSDGFVGSPFCS